MSIHPILQKIKALWLKTETEAVLMILIIVLVGLAGFGLGRISTAGEGRAVIIEENGRIQENPLSSLSAKDSLANVINSANSGIVASKNGTKYYLAGCSGAGRIQDQNKIYFSTEQEALDAGYTKANGCDK